MLRRSPRCLLLLRFRLVVTEGCSDLRHTLVLRYFVIFEDLFFLPFTILLLIVIFIKNYNMSKVENGKSVIVHYTGRFEDGTVFDTSLTEGREPINTELGQGSLIKGFESGLIGMSEGEKKTIELLPEDGYGEYLVGLVIIVK